MEINRKQFGKMQYRAAFGPFLNVFNVLKLKIQEEHRDIIKGTPFWGLFKAYDGGLVSDDMCRKTYVDIIRIINCFNAGTSEFKFGDRCEKLTGFEVEELLGLPNFGRDINLNERCSKSEEGFITRNFKTVDRVTRQNIESAMITIVTEKTQQNREDFVCLMCLHLCITLLFCNSGSTISWNITSRCQDVRTMAGYNWAKATSDCLQKQLVKNCGKPSHVSGCVVLLPFWFCEISSLVEPVKGRMDLAPKFVKWDLQVLHEAMSAIEIDKLQISDASESHMNISLRCEPHVMVSPHRDSDQDFQDVNDVHKTPAIGILKSKFRSYESQQPIAAHKSLSKNMTSSVTVAMVTSEKKNLGVANHRLTTGVSGGSNFDEIRTKEVVSTTSKKEFNPSKMFQLISSQDNLFHKGRSECKLVEAHNVPKNSELSVEQRLEKERSENKLLKEEIKKLKIEVEVAQVHSVVYHEMCCDTEALVADAYNQYDDLSSDLTQLLECIEKEMGENKHASSPVIATWIVRLKRKQRKPKRLTGFVYDEMKSWREPKKVKLNEIVPSVVNPAENDEIVDTTKGKAQIGSEAIGRHTVKGKQRIGVTLDPSCMSVWMYLSNEEQDRMHQYFLCADSGVPFWKGSYSAVYKDDLRDLLTGSAITCNVIDTFGEILLAELGKEGRMKTISHIMTTYSWEYLQRGDGKSVGQFLFDPLLDVLSRVDYIIFPMRHHDQFHFTLLVLQKDEEQWVHYDPMRCVTDTSNDRCFADAEKLRDAVTMFLQYNSCIAPVMLNDGYRMRQSISEGERSIQSPLMQSEIQTLQWLISADPNYPLWPSLSCPRQLDGSLDCGIVVMYYMSTISRSQTMVKEFSVNKMKEYRAQIIRKYLSDAKCWEYE